MTKIRHGGVSYTSLDSRYFTQSQLGSTTAPSGASLIGVADAGGYFAGTNVEAVLQEIVGVILPGEYLRLDGTNIPTANYNWTTNLTTTGTLQGATITDGTFSITAGVGTGLVSLTDGVASWAGGNLAGFGTIQANTSVTASTLTIAGGSITDTSGAISFGNENLTTTGNIQGLNVTGTNSVVANTMTLSTGSITDTTGAISFGNENLTTTGDITGRVLISTVAIGTAPLTITSTTLVTNLNADRVDGAHVGTSGATIPLLNAANTWSNTQLFSTTTQLQFRAATQRIYSSAVGQLDIDADSELEITAPIVDIDAATGLALDGANLNSNWTVNTTNRIYFRDANCYIYSNAANEITIAGSSKTIVGVAGDIILGDGTERNMYPQTNKKENLGTTINKFNKGYFGGMVDCNETGVRTKTTTAAVVASPPTDAQLDTIFGQPAALGAGFMGFVEDTTDNQYWFVITDGTSWYYEELDIAV